MMSRFLFHMLLQAKGTHMSRHGLTTVVSILALVTVGALSAIFIGGPRVFSMPGRANSPKATPASNALKVMYNCNWCYTVFRGCGGALGTGEFYAPCADPQVCPLPACNDDPVYHVVRRVHQFCPCPIRDD